MIDELDDVLARALHERGRHVGAPMPRPADVRRRVVRRRRRRIAVPLTAVLGLAVGLVASRALPTRTSTVTVDAPAAPSSSAVDTTVSGTTATTVATPASPVTTVATAPADVPWFGIDDPNWLPVAAIEVRAPGYLRGHRMLQYRADGDWRSTPAIDVVDRDLTSGDDLRNAEATSIGGRPGWIGRYAESTVVRIEIAASRVAEVEGRGVDEDALVAAAASTRLDGTRLAMPAPAGLTLLADVPLEGPHAAHRIVYEAADDPTGQRRLSIMVSTEPVFAVMTGEHTTLAGQPAIATGGGTVALVDGRYALAGYVMDPGQGVGQLPDGIRQLTADEVGRLAIATTDASTLDAPMPMTPDAQRKGDAFAAALPPGYEGVQPRESNDGSGVGWGVLSTTDRWIWIELVRATAGDPVAAQEPPVVASEDAHRRVVRWRSPTGWVYELTADGLKAGAPPPLTVEQMTAILRAIEAA